MEPPFAFSWQHRRSYWDADWMQIAPACRPGWVIPPPPPLQRVHHSLSLGLWSVLLCMSNALIHQQVRWLYSIMYMCIYLEYVCLFRKTSCEAQLLVKTQIWYILDDYVTKKLNLYCNLIYCWWNWWCNPSFGYY